MLYYYSGAEGRSLYWSDHELTEDERRRANVVECYPPGRHYDRMCAIKGRDYLVRPVPIAPPKLRPEEFNDPDNPKIKLIRFVPDED